MDTPNGSNTNVLKKTPQEEKADISAKIKELAKDPSKNAKELATLAIRNVKLERELEGKGEEIPEEEIKELSEQTLDDLQKQPKEQVKETVKKSVTKELAEKEKKRAEEGDKLDKKAGKEDLIEKYKELLNTNEILEKQNKELKDVMFDKNELIISPREYLRRRNLIKMKNRIDMLKQKGYPRSAVIYFMCMKKFWDGGKAGAAIKRGMLKADIGSFFTRGAGGINIENLKNEMAYCLERFNPGKEKGSARVRFMKKSIYDEIKTATNTYIDSVAQKNKI